MQMTHNITCRIHSLLFFFRFICFFCLLIGICALVLAVKSLGEENSFKLFPYLSTLCSILITGIWVALYVIGFLA